MKTSTKNIYTRFILLLLMTQNILTLSAQNLQQGATFILNTTITGNQIYEASDYIKLMPGFSYTATSSESFIARINKDAYAYATYLQTPIDGTSRPLNVSLAVGTIHGEFGATATGAASYTIPLILPPGTNNMVPPLSLNYNSQGNNGIMGIGWNLDGLSAITRVPQTILQDGQTIGVTMQQTDRFALDGNRLVTINGQYGAAASIYHTELESFSKITANGSIGAGPDWFLVETKDGRIIEYGNSTDSKVLLPGNTGVYNWLVNKISDKQGNYIEYIYHNHLNYVYIDEIRYTGNTNSNLSPYNVIKFRYIKRTIENYIQNQEDLIDENQIYICGTPVTKELLLSEIIITNEGTQAHRYKLDYFFSKIQSCLNQVTEYDADDNGFNSTVFNYNNTEDALSVNECAPINNDYDGSATQLFTGDFNGDGWTDYLAVNNSIMHVELSDYDGTHNMGTQDPGGKIEDLQVGDFNGDGTDDIIFKVNSTLYLGLSTFGVQYNNFFTITNLSASGLNISPWYQLHFGDFNGDGKKEILLLNSSSSSSTYQIISHPLSITSSITLPLQNPSSYSKFFCGDFNGDGKDELLCQGADCEIFSNLNSTNPVLFYQTNLFSYMGHSCYTGDFNGDGKIDLLVSYVNTPWTIFYSTGTTLIQTTAQVPEFSAICPVGGCQSTITYVKDFNGDGKSDVCSIAVGSPDEPANLRIVYSKGNNNFLAYSTTVPSSYSTSTPTYTQHFVNYASFFHVGDFNGDGKMECSYNPYFLKIDSEGHPYEEDVEASRVVSFPLNQKKELVKSITNGFNKTIEFTYKPLCYKDDPQIYNPMLINNFVTNPQTYPMSYYTSSSYVLETVKTPDGIGGFITGTYAYEDALTNKTGRGFLGFKKITESLSTNEVITNEYELLNGVTILAFKHNKKENPVGTTVNESQYTNLVYNTYPNVYFTYKSAMSYTNQLNGTSYGVNYNYGTGDIAYGNLTSETTNYLTDNANTTKSYTYMTAGAWCPGKVNTIIASYQRLNQASITKRTTFDYYTTGSNIGLPKTMIINPNLSNSLTYNFSSYNTFGNLLQVVISAADIASRSISFTYDDKGRFITKSINPLNQTDREVVLFDSKYGNANDIKDINGLHTLYEYDGFGRLTKITQPDGQITNYSLGWDASGSHNNDLFYSSASYTLGGHPPIINYFDFLQRNVEKITKGNAGEDIVSDIDYNHKGLIEHMSEPHFASASIINIEDYTYDANNRCLTVVSPTKNMTYSYGTNTITTTNVLTGQSTTKINNSFGEAAQITESGGNTINYTYNSFGQVKQINIGSSNTLIEYDAYGKQSSLTDPDAGTSNYIYNSLGELTDQTDARSNHYTLTYDLLGRIHSNAGPDGTTTYTYDTQTNGLGRLAQVTGPSSTGINYYYQYDPLSRLNQERELIDGTNYYTNYGYDSYGNINAITYPSGYAISKTYNNYGYLSYIKDAATNNTIYFNSNFNALGQVTDYTYGNGLSTQNTYNDIHHHLTSMQVTPFSGGAALFSYTYGYDASSFLMNSRTDNIHNKSESFTYDTYNRLDTITGNNGVPSSTLTYDPNGNILSNSTNGNYGYAVDAGEHAVTSIAINNNCSISQSPQDITYTPFNKVATIAEDNINMTFTYGPDHARKKVTTTQNGNTITKYYLPNYEKEINGGITRELTYINGSDGLAAIYEKYSNNSSGTMYYTHKDHLGSIIGATNQNKTIVTQESYDAWGNRRNPATWQPYTTATPPSAPLFFGRGFTGQEHLEQFALINLNGRLYDPKVGRFLSPDIYNQAPDFSQNYNRYSYCLNNPLNLKDITGNEYEEDNYYGRDDLGYDGLSDGGLGYDDGDGGPTKGKKLTYIPRERYDDYDRDYFNDQQEAYNSYEQNGQDNYELNEEGGDDDPPAGEGDKAAGGLAAGWAIALTEPTPVGEITMGFATTFAVLYYGPDIVKKMQTEIDNIMTKSTGPQGFQYALLAVRSGNYPNVRGGTTFLNKGEVWKYGETTSSIRYSVKYLNSMGLSLQPQFIGNQVEIKIQEKIMIYAYFMLTGSLPPGNSIFR